MPGLRLNLSAGRRGLTTGLSLGGNGARVSFNSRGEQRTTFGVPGTGLSHVTTTGFVEGAHQGAGNHDIQPRADSQVAGWIVVGVLALGFMWFIGRAAGRNDAPVPAATHVASASTVGFVSASSLRCRATASAAAPVITGFVRGAPLQVLDATAGWTRVSFQGGGCWVASRYLASSPPS